MKQHKSYIVCLLVGTLLASCADSPLDNLPSEELVQLNLLPPTIEATPLTRTMPIDGTTFPWEGRNHSTSGSGRYLYTDYSLALYVCNDGTYVPHANGYTNKLTTLRVTRDMEQYTTAYSWSSGLPSLRLNQNVDIYAYYPHDNNHVANPDVVPFTTYLQKDWMWATPINLDQVSESNRTVQLSFKHAMTCIEVRLSTKYKSTVELYKIILNDTKSTLVNTGTMDITNGSLTYTADQSSITIQGNNANKDLLPVYNEGYYSYCFLMPEKSFNEGELSLSFVYDYVYPNFTQGRATYTIPTSFADGHTVTKLETGKKYVLNLVIDNTSSIYPLSQQIDEWTTVDVNLKI